MLKLLLSIFIITTIITNDSFATNKSKLKICKVKSDTLVTLISRVRNQEFLSIPATAVWITRAKFSVDGRTVNFYTGAINRQALNVPVVYARDQSALYCEFIMSDGVQWKFSASITGIQLITKQQALYSTGLVKYNKTLLRN